MVIKPILGYNCPICREVYEAEEYAYDCIASHVEYITDLRRVMSSEYPVIVRIWKEVGGERVAYQDYKLDGKPVEIKQ